MDLLNWWFSSISQYILGGISMYIIINYIMRYCDIPIYNLLFDPCRLEDFPIWGMGAHGSQEIVSCGSPDLLGMRCVWCLEIKNGERGKVVIKGSTSRRVDFPAWNSSEIPDTIGIDWHYWHYLQIHMFCICFALFKNRHVETHNMCMGLHLDEAQWLFADQSFNAVFPKLNHPLGPETSIWSGPLVRFLSIFGSLKLHHSWPIGKPQDFILRLLQVRAGDRLSAEQVGT